MSSGRAVNWYTVPAGKQPKPCRAKDVCDKAIYLVRSQKTPGAFIPVDCDVPGGKRPTATEHGLGVNHYETCKDPNRFRRSNRPASPAQIGQAQQREMPVAHKSPSCIVCGCTSGARCSIPKSELDALEQDIQVGRYSLIGPHELPETVSCYFIQFNPPVCSKPDCRAKRQSELPLRMRGGG